VYDFSLVLLIATTSHHTVLVFWIYYIVSVE